MLRRAFSVLLFLTLATRFSILLVAFFLSLNVHPEKPVFIFVFLSQTLAQKKRTLFAHANEI